MKDVKMKQTGSKHQGGVESRNVKQWGRSRANILAWANGSLMLLLPLVLDTGSFSTVLLVNVGQGSLLGLVLGKQYK